MKRNSLYLLLPVLALAGCELLVDFDRTKIPADSADGSIIVPVGDGSIEPTDGSSDNDGATDEDAAADSGSDASTASDAGDAGETDGSSDDGGTDDAGDDAGDGG